MHGPPVPAVQASVCIAPMTNVGIEFAKLAAMGLTLTQDCIAASRWQTVLVNASPARRAFMLMQMVQVRALHAQQVHIMIKTAPAPKSLALHVQRVLMPKKVPALAPSVQKDFMPMKKVQAPALHALWALTPTKKVPALVLCVPQDFTLKQAPVRALPVQRALTLLKKVPALA